ncbi:odorant receptor 131-2-like [Hyla sarda]|uniref:odorant receptor 131-2-like n=1 Tax=Hyla sarda TaxID=327740 RepID=UPI0024C356DB|nr:odorant receptor 131-2-like [Hyla sarda]
MVNSTQLNTNMTSQVNKPSETAILIISILMFLLFGIFVYFMVIILNIFFTTPQVRETARYILFIHMLLNDVVYLVVAFVLFLSAFSLTFIPVPICYVIVSFSTCSFCITPYNLAVMSLERYTAICHPLRHMELWTVKRATLAIAYMWTVGMIPQLADFFTFCFSGGVFHFSVLCRWKSLSVSIAQEIIKTLTSILSFSMVGLIIAFTYIKVILVARRMDSEKFASKAGKTVLLHAFQLLLCMLSFASAFIEATFKSSVINVPSMNFFLLMCIPRFVSPLIYGIRDEVFGKRMRRLFSTARI